MLDELRRGLETAYIDGSVVSNESLRPQFVSNNFMTGYKSQLVFMKEESMLARSN